MARPGDARALAALLRARMDIEGPGMFVPPGDRAALMAQLSRLGSVDPPVSVHRAVGTEIGSIASIDKLREAAESCTRCSLHESRRAVVFADGPDRARVMCVGEAPGAREDETGMPFVGRAGQLLDRLLVSVGLSREDVYIANVLKCRPPGNRNPQPEEIERCSPFLRRQVVLVGPEVVVAFGTFAAQTLLGVRETLGRLRGRVHEYEGVPLVATYHPAALLRNPQWTRPSWEDLQRVRHLLAENEGA